MELQLAASGDLDGMHLGTNGRGRPRRPASVVDGDATRPAFGQRRSPPRHLGYHVEGLQEVIAVSKASDPLLGLGRIAREQLAAIQVRILAGDVGQLIDEAFHVEGIGGCAGPAARPDRNVGLRGVKREAVVRHEIRRRRQPAIPHIAQIPRGGVTHFHRDRPSAGIQTRLEETDAHRAIPGAGPPVFFAGP